MPERSVILSTLVPTMPQEELDRRAHTRNAYTKLPADQKYTHVDRVLDAPGPFTDEAFQGGDAAKQFLRNTCKVLVIGAGGLGCEILQNLALSRFPLVRHSFSADPGLQWGSTTFMLSTWIRSIFPT